MIQLAIVAPSPVIRAGLEALAAAGVRRIREGFVLLGEAAAAA